MGKGFRVPRDNLHILNYRDLENPTYFTALKVRKTAPRWACYLPNFQLTQSLFVMYFLVASTIRIYVQQAFFLTWQLFSFSKVAIL